jgi:hypothetical protein
VHATLDGSLGVPVDRSRAAQVVSPECVAVNLASASIARNGVHIERMCVFVLSGDRG